MVDNPDYKKQCTRCHITKPSREFYLYKPKGSPLSSSTTNSWCKNCANKYTVKYNFFKRRYGSESEKGFEFSKCIVCDELCLSKDSYCDEHSHLNPKLVKKKTPEVKPIIFCHLCRMSSKEKRLYNVPTSLGMIYVCFACNDSDDFNIWWYKTYHAWWKTQPKYT